MAGIRAVIVAVAVGGGARPSAAGLGPDPGAARGARAVHRREGRAALCDEGGGRVVDFTQPFYSAGLGIAVASDAGITWWPIIRNVFSLRKSL